MISVTLLQVAVQILDQMLAVQHDLHLLISMAGLPMLVTALAMAVTGMHVLSRERSSAQTWSFFILTLSAAIWLAGIGLMLESADASTAAVFSRLSFAGIAAIPAAVFQFTAVLLHRGLRLRPLTLLAWAISSVFTLLFTSTHHLLDGVWHYSWGFYPRLTPASAAFLSYFAVALGGSLLMLTAALSAERSDQEKKRIRSFLFALGASYLGSIDWLPCFGIEIYPAGFLAMGAFIALSMSAISRFRLNDLSAAFVADQLLQTMEGGVIVVDLAGRIRVFNPTSAALLGHSRTTLLGADFSSLLQQPMLPETGSSTFIRGGRTRNRPMRWRKGDGTFVEVAVSSAMLRDGAGLPVGILYVANDVQEKRRAERAEHDAQHDALTGLPNRAALRLRFDEMREHVAGRGRTATLFFLDLDGFKHINDQHGHAAGDRVLQLLSSRLCNALREDDVVARFGGDEFIVLVNLRSAEDSALVAQKIVRVVNEPYVIGELRLQVGTSIGAAFYPYDGHTLEELLRAADAAMYEAKRVGRNQFRTAAAKRTRGMDIEGPPPFNVEARS